MCLKTQARLRTPDAGRAVRPVDRAPERSRAVRVLQAARHRAGAGVSL